MLLSRADHGFSIGFSFGFGWFGAGISWVHVSIADFGGVPLIGSIGLMALLCGYLALYPAIFAAVLKKWTKPSYWPLAAAFIWFVCEWLRSWVMTGFPWLSLGYSQIASPLSGWMPIIGESGVSLILIILASALATAIVTKKSLSAVLVSIVFLVSGWTFNQIQWVQVEQSPVSISMVQGNIKQELRWTPEQDLPTMLKYLSMTKAHWDNDIVIWPEAAVPQLEIVAHKYLQELDLLAASSQTGLVTGIVDYNFDSEQAFNNLIVLGQQSSEPSNGHYQYMHSNRFSKHHLLPIGEFIPLEDWLRGLAPIFDLPMSSFSRGGFQQQNLEVKGYYLSPAICFEIAFPRQIAANIDDDTDFIVTVSNDAWFGHSHGPHQHLEIAQARAKEFGIPVLRATNTGITAFIDHTGQIISRLPQFEAAVLTEKVTTTNGYTPYYLFGDLPAFLVSILLFLISLRIQSTKQRLAK